VIPVRLDVNRPRQFYRGGARIEAFRGIDEADGYRPEDWIASATPRFGCERDGLTTLPDGRLLRDAVEADPEGWLGAQHVERFGADTGLLVKLLDVGERLPVHCHPSRPFARRHLGCAHGKTEAWLVLAADGDDALVYVGFREEVERETLRGWVATQDREALLDALNPIAVECGDAMLVPAGVPHAIGAGVFVVELQEPTDFSILLERAGFDLGAATPALGLGDETALESVDCSAWTGDRLGGLRRSREGGEARGRSLLPPAADPFFRAECWRFDGTADVEVGYAVLVVLGGRAALRPARSAELALERGATILVPFGAGATVLDGDVDLVRCRPPVEAP
jgi:mannose-6-phosphate isomerase